MPLLALLWHMPGRVWRGALKAAPLRVWALFGAAIALTLAGVALVWIIWRGGWPEALAGRRLDYLGWALLADLALIAILIVALTSVRVKAAGPGGLSLELDHDDDETASVKTTIKTEIG